MLGLRDQQIDRLRRWKRVALTASAASTLGLAAWIGSQTAVAAPVPPAFTDSVHAKTVGHSTRHRVRSHRIVVKATAPVTSPIVQPATPASTPVTVTRTS
jgi:hypothetical protein